MRTTVVHRRHVDITIRCSRRVAPARAALRPRTYPTALSVAIPAAPWSTTKLGVVISAVAVIVAVVLDLATAVPSHVIVLSVMAAAFAASLHATTRRPVR